MSKKDIVVGHATVAEFISFMEERHRIFLKRQRGEAWPWTEDEILKQFKFTNVFRELDRGTTVLRSRLNEHIDQGFALELTLFNVIWYRFFNWHENLLELGIVKTFDTLYSGMKARHKAGKKVFTSCHMTTGVSCEDKIDTYLKCCKTVWDDRKKIVDDIIADPTLEDAFDILRQYYLIGPFVAYEMVSDLRWTPLLEEAQDILTWANIGPGCRRGLMRLGLPVELSSLTTLWRAVRSHATISSPHTKLEDYNDEVKNPLRLHFLQTYPPFEMREIEHSLCEFDKYQRAKTGVGRPREIYRAPV